MGRVNLARTDTLQGYAWVIGEQMGFSISQVLAQVAASRTLSQGDYGIFSLVNATTLLLLRVHYAFLIEPVLVLHPAIHREKQQDYVRGVLALQSKVERRFAFLCAGLSLLAWVYSVESALLLLGAMIFCLGAAAMNFRRKIAYLTGNAKATTWSTALRGALGLGALLALDKVFGLSAWSALLVLGSCFFVPGTRSKPEFRRELEPEMRGQLFQHGRLAILVLVAWGGVDAAPHYVLAILGGVQTVASYQIAAALFGPVVQLAGTVLTAALPRLVIMKGDRRDVFVLACWGLGLTAAGALGVAFVGPWLIPIVFGERYSASAEYLLPLAPFPTFLIAAHMLGNWNKAHGKQSVLLFAGLGALPLMGLSLMLGHQLAGLYGASLGVTGGYAVFAALVAVSSLIASGKKWP